MTEKTSAPPTVRVSIVMAVHNAAPFLRAAVDSMLAQTLADFELIAVDDASSDDSLRILESYTDPRVRIVRHSENQGAAVSRNDAMAVARGEYVAVMDADDISLPLRLAVQVKFLDEHPAVGLVGAGVYDNIDVQGSVLYVSHLPEDNETIQRTLTEQWCFLHPSIMFRARLLDQTGGFRKEFEPAEDHDFILRLLEHCEACNLSQKLVSYRINPRGLSVVGHEYITEIGEAAMRVAVARRQGRAENLADELRKATELKSLRKAGGLATRMVRAWRDSFYAAGRYYGFGCKELYGGDPSRARRCFRRSISLNCLFVRSWICLVLSFFPFVLERVKFLFRTSMRHQQEMEQLRGAGTK
jgi:glycosyltransferase involved in cell wall biosynthesis